MLLVSLLSDKAQRLIGVLTAVTALTGLDCDDIAIVVSETLLYKHGRRLTAAF